MFLTLPVLIAANFPVSQPARSELDPDFAGSIAHGPASFGGALRASALGELAIAAEVLSAAAPCPDEGMTQARKAIRRTRALLDLAHEALGRDGDALDDELKQLSQDIAARLDGRPLVDALDTLRDDPTAAPPRELLARVRGVALEIRAARAQASRPDDMLRGRVGALSAPLAALPWHAFEDAAALRALARSIERADAAGRRAVRGDKDPEWHHWRRRVRRAWQQTHVMNALHPVDAGTCAGPEALTRHLAIARHAVLIVGHCSDLSPFPGEDRRLLLDFACGQLQRHRAAAIALFSSRPTGCNKL